MSSPELNFGRVTQELNERLSGFTDAVEWKDPSYGDDSTFYVAYGHTTQAPLSPGGGNPSITTRVLRESKPFSASDPTYAVAIRTGDDTSPHVRLIADDYPLPDGLVDWFAEAANNYYDLSQTVRWESGTLKVITGAGYHASSHHSTQRGLDAIAQHPKTPNGQIVSARLIDVIDPSGSAMRIENGVTVKDTTTWSNRSEVISSPPQEILLSPQSLQSVARLIVAASAALEYPEQWRPEAGGNRVYR